MRRWLKHEPDLELDVLMSKSKPIIHKAFELHEYPKEIVCSGWLALAQGISEKIQSKKDVIQSLHLLSTLGGSLGRAHIPLFDTSYAEEMNSGS